MVLYNKAMKNGMKDRPSRTINIELDEHPQRPVPLVRNDRERVKFIKKVESVVRSSMEYKDHMQFLKNNMDMRKCTVLSGLKVEGGKRYTIEIHHEPFTLFDITETVMNYNDAIGEPLSVLKMADTIMALHYEDKIGLIPLSATMHELVHTDKIFIPLQYVYQSYATFYKIYEDYMNPKLKEKIEAKVNCSMKCPDILSDTIDPEFTYIKIDGFELPTIPTEWKDIMSVDGTASEG